MILQIAIEARRPLTVFEVACAMRLTSNVQGNLARVFKEAVFFKEASKMVEPCNRKSSTRMRAQKVGLSDTQVTVLHMRTRKHHLRKALRQLAKVAPRTVVSHACRLGLLSRSATAAQPPLGPRSAPNDCPSRYTHNLDITFLAAAAPTPEFHTEICEKCLERSSSKCVPAMLRLRTARSIVLLTGTMVS
jgi:hypothetical protein